jgi:hypothetical protein
MPGRKDYGLAERVTDGWFRLTGSIVFSRYLPDPECGTPQLLRYRAVADPDGAAYEVTIRSRGPLGRVLTREIWNRAALTQARSACTAVRPATGAVLPEFLARKLRLVAHLRFVHRVQ